jgi:hypothetical protein
MRKPILAVAILAVALTPAFAHEGGQAKSTISFEGFEKTGAGALLYGFVDSSKNKCRKRRTVELYDRNKDGSVRKVIDTDTTSTRGAWSAVLKKGDNPQNLFARVKKSEAGDTKCGGSLTIIIF